MKMEPIVSYETSAIRIQTPGNYPKRNKLKDITYLLLISRIVEFFMPPIVISRERES